MLEQAYIGSVSVKKDIDIEENEHLIISTN